MRNGRNMRFLNKALILIGGLLFGAFPATGQVADPSFPCDGAFYLATSTSSGSKLHRLVRDTATGIVRAEEITLSDPGIRLTCLGYSVRDMHLYALNFETYELLRINATGHIVNLGVPNNLNTEDYQYYAGDVNANGTALVVIGREKASGTDKVVYTINITSPQPSAGSVSVVSNVPVAIADITTDPISGVRYGFDSRNRQLVTLGSGDVSTFQFNNITAAAHALFFDRQGRLFGFGDPAGGSSSTRLLGFEKTSGEAERLAWQGASGADSDGCSCPYTIRFTRTVTPSVILPCTEVTVEYEIINHSGLGRLGGVFRDLFPPEFTISRIEENSANLSRLEAGPGGNLLELRNYDMRLGRNVLRLAVAVGENAEGAYEMQASIDNLPRALGETLISDDPATPAPSDANVVEISDAEQLNLNLEAVFTCDRDSVTLVVPVAPADYRWSNGATTRSITVPASGAYWVEASNDCLTFGDTVEITGVPDPLSLELGENRSLPLGARLPLSFTTNGEAPLRYRWSTSSGQGLSCMDCPNPVFEALEDANITLQITDAQGCTAEDILSIEVDPVRKLYLPNAFSPNNDGVNDRFFPQGTNGVIERFQVFNRWGATVFESNGGTVNDNAIGWDGRVMGLPAEKGLYLFVLVIAFPDGQEETFSGEVMLLR